MSRKFKILKRSGKKESFSIQKLKKALIRAGSDSELADRVAKKVLSKVRRGYSTQNIYELAKRYLISSHPVLGAKYTLREAVYRLGPAGYDFEKYIMLLFKEHGYNTYLPNILNGECVSHEVDVIAEKNSKRIMMECKLRKDSAIYINIKDSLANWARFIDLQGGSRTGRCFKLDEAWIVTNSRFSKDALMYGKCKNMKMISWDEPTVKPLPAYIDVKNLYPVTILQSIRQYHLKALSKSNILLLKDLLGANLVNLCKKTLLNNKQLEPLLLEAKQILSHNHKTQIER